MKSSGATSGSKQRKITHGLRESPAPGQALPSAYREAARTEPFFGPWPIDSGNVRTCDDLASRTEMGISRPANPHREQYRELDRISRSHLRWDRSEQPCGRPNRVSPSMSEGTGTSRASFPSTRPPPCFLDLPRAIPHSWVVCPRPPSIVATTLTSGSSRARARRFAVHYTRSRVSGQTTCRRRCSSAPEPGGVSPWVAWRAFLECESALGMPNRGRRSFAGRLPARRLTRSSSRDRGSEPLASRAPDARSER